MRLIIGDIYQGREKYATDRYGTDITIYRGLSEDVRAGVNANLIIEKAESFDVVIAEEGYCGLTPIEAEERLFTEQYGQALIELAKRAESVERVVCGLAISLK